MKTKVFRVYANDTMWETEIDTWDGAHIKTVEVLIVVSQAHQERARPDARGWLDSIEYRRRLCLCQYVPLGR